MEPGHEDREYIVTVWCPASTHLPQWSPVMKTGNTRRPHLTVHLLRLASMEPGHEDREYRMVSVMMLLLQGASMEPGHEDREYQACWRPNASSSPGLNGARS